MKHSTGSSKQAGDRPTGRWQFVFASLFASAFALNVALRMLFIKAKIDIWRLGDVGEFVLVLAAMAFFVSGVLAIEEAPESSVAPTHDNT